MSEPEIKPTSAESKVLPYRTPPKSFGSRAASSFRVWSRDTFNRDQMISSLKSLAWVAPLTILIWVYAEREQILSQPNQTIPISVKSADPKLIVTIAQEEASIIAEISGPHSSVDKITEELKLIANNKQGVVIEIPSSFSAGTYTIPTSWVGEAELFKRAGVTVSKISPQNLHVQIDRMEDRDVDVKVPADVNNLVGTTTFEPRTVRITGPHTVLDAADAQGKLNVYANFKGFNELRVPGKHDLTAVPLTIGVSDKNVTVSPTSLKATIEVRQMEADYLVNSMPVWVTYPPGFEDYHVVFNDGPNTVTNVTLFGPGEEIEAMKKPDFKPQPKARIELSPSDKSSVGDTRTAKLIFDLPFPDVHVSEKDSNRTILYHIEKRATVE